MEKIGVKLNVTVPDEMKAEVERIAKRHNIKEAEAARKLLEIGLEAYQVYEKIGVPQLSEIVKKAKTAFRDQIQMRLA